MEALLYDVHGNLPALEAVIAHAGDVDRFILGGDYALFGGWPRETVERLRALPDALWIRGNGERWTAEPDHPTHPGAVDAAREALGAQLVRDLAALPMTAGREDTLFCHASPASDVHSFAPEPGDDDAGLLADVTAGRLVFGHTHVPFRRAVDAIELVNPGSVGMPLDGDTRAAYAVVHEDGRIEHRRVGYDHEASAARVRELGDWGAVIAERILRARNVPF
jgi:diadenosine tetraphosphatase ApaH/serine/threonine PP2A family protein phosphatase